MGTSDPKEADKLVGQMNELLRENLIWNIDAKHIAEKLYDPIVISAFYDVLEKQEMVPFIIVYESGLGKGWDIIGAIDAKDALEKFKEKEPDICKLCQSPCGSEKRERMSILSIDMNTCFSAKIVMLLVI